MVIFPMLNSQRVKRNIFDEACQLIFEVAEQNECECTVWINDQNQKGIHRNTTFGWMNSHFIPSYFGGHRELATRPLVQVLHRGMCQQPGLFADCHSRPRAPSTVDFTGIHWISWDIEPWTNYMTFKWWQFHGKNQLHYVKLWQFGNMRTKRRCFSAESLGQSHIAEGSGRSFFWLIKCATSARQRYVNISVQLSTEESSKTTISRWRLMNSQVMQGDKLSIACSNEGQRVWSLNKLFCAHSTYIYIMYC